MKMLMNGAASVNRADVQLSYGIDVMYYEP